MKRKLNQNSPNLQAKRSRLEDRDADEEFFISSEPQAVNIDDSSPPKISQSIQKNVKSRTVNSETSSTKSTRTKRKQRRPDVDEARTVYIKNLSLETDERKLNRFLSNFGKLNFVKIVKDKITHQPRGSAFAKFASKDGADNILVTFSKPENADQFVFDGRQLSLTLAVSREDLEQQRHHTVPDKSATFAKDSDVSEARTIFIRNVSFDVEERRLLQFLSSFGELEFVKIVKDPATSHSRGTAFAKFVSKADADRTLLLSSRPENAHRFTFAGRPLNLSLAISRDDVKRKQSARKDGDWAVDGDEVVVADGSKGRNLHLARIGIIRPASQQAEEMTSKEAAMRESVLRAKEAKLKNPNIFISPLRLCLRNIPLDVDDKALRQACQRVTGPKARITEARVMRDVKSGQVNPKSLGFAFVSFEEHNDALEALQVINNNSGILGGSRKPIVEFSLENSRALDRRKKRAEKSLIIKEGGVRPEMKQSRTPPWSSAIRRGKLPKLKKKKASSQKGVRVLPKKFGPKIRKNRPHGRT